jgi:DNA replication protein DnaC
MNDFEKLMAETKPVSESEYRAYVLKSEILPMIGNWGFEVEFQHELAKLNPEQQAVLEKLERRMFSGNGAIVALVGERGLGKTSITAQFALKIAWKNYEASRDGKPYRKHVIYRKCARVVDRYKPLFADFGCIDPESLRQSMDMFCHQQEFVVIDEVHECDDMKYKRAVLTDVVDRRYAAKLPTVLIANQTPQDFAASIGDSILSRLNQYGAILPCKWPSYRKQ